MDRSDLAPSPKADSTSSVSSLLLLLLLLLLRYSLPNQTHTAFSTPIPSIPPPLIPALTLVSPLLSLSLLVPNLSPLPYPLSLGRLLAAPLPLSAAHLPPERPRPG
ncbi:MAG: hypothetical protein Q9159_004091 [Coniocarpon cinnabarinum]